MSAIRKTASVVYSTAARKSQITLLEADVKKLTCRDLGGPCDAEITGNSFEEVGKKSHDHVMDQISRGDESHRAAAEKNEKRVAGRTESDDGRVGKEV